MDLERLFLGAFGALVGVIGWLFVGIYIQRRQFDRQARDAARAVYFELLSNELNVQTALEFGAFGQLSRSTFERLLPELSTWLPATELQALVIAYMGHAGYQQAAEDTSVPEELRRRALAALREAHGTALGALRARAFTRAEVEQMAANATAAEQRALEGTQGAEA
ncbi:MAG: hypothetical protein H0X16_09255 [Chloroflexi bacterium]|nr:hypothetical protein [Chloroflexota bacterium]